jgi:hypothetical protein
MRRRTRRPPRQPGHGAAGTRLSQACLPQPVDGTEEQRIAGLSQESELHARLIRLALDYAAHHANEVRDRIARNRAAAERSRATAQQRNALLA